MLSSFPLATALASSSRANSKDTRDRNYTKNNNELLLLHMQMKMIYLHVQTLPSRTVQLARKALLKSAAGAGEIGSGRGRGGGDRVGNGSTKRKGTEGECVGGGGAHIIAAALSALDLLDVGAVDDRHEKSGIVSLDTAQHGLPQHRERVFIVGLRKRHSHHVPKFRWPRLVPCCPLASMLDPLPSNFDV
jgi:hypothetical protein